MLIYTKHGYKGLDSIQEFILYTGFQMTITLKKTMRCARYARFEDSFSLDLRLAPTLPLHEVFEQCQE